MVRNDQLCWRRLLPRLRRSGSLRKPRPLLHHLASTHIPGRPRQIYTPTRDALRQMATEASKIF